MAWKQQALASRRRETWQLGVA